MFKNYCLTAWKVFVRRKFFTFINLFGICVTLTVLFVVTSVADNMLYPSGPEKGNGNYRVIDRLILTNESHTSTRSSRPGFKFMQKYVLSLKSPDIISVFTTEDSAPTYLQSKKIVNYLRRTDSNYWKILEFEFLHGGPFNEKQFESGQLVAVISQHTVRQYFDSENPIGKTINIQEQPFKVIGVVKNVARTEMNAFADIWVPYTTFPTTAYREQMMGTFKAMLFNADANKLEETRLEFIHALKNDFKTEDGKFTEAFSFADTPFESMAREPFGGKKDFDSPTGLVLTVIILIVAIFMLLPSINMVNLNISRMLERSSEIGVRKAFGASTRQLVMQFIIESILLTLAGSVIALIISLFVLYSIESSGVVPNVEFILSFRIFAVSLLIVFVFSLFSGAYPALKMANLNPVDALKGGR